MQGFWFERLTVLHERLQHLHKCLDLEYCTRYRTTLFDESRYNLRLQYIVEDSEMLMSLVADVYCCMLGVVHTIIIIIRNRMIS